jgi:hypothetical protein
MMTPRDYKVDYNGALIDRGYYHNILDLDRSTDTPEEIINLFRFVKLFGMLFEQSSCNADTSDASFKLRARIM